jgi:hypothetical protein
VKAFFFFFFLPPSRSPVIYTLAFCLRTPNYDKTDPSWIKRFPTFWVKIDSMVISESIFKIACEPSSLCKKICING